MAKSRLITDPEEKYQLLHKQRISSAQKGDIPLPPSNRPAPNVLSPYIKAAGALKAGRKKLK